MFEYRITWYNDVTTEETRISGLVSGKTYGEAAEKILRTYGESSVIDLYLRMLTDTSIIELDTLKEQLEW